MSDFLSATLKVLRSTHCWILHAAPLNDATSSKYVVRCLARKRICQVWTSKLDCAEQSPGGKQKFDLRRVMNAAENHASELKVIILTDSGWTAAKYVRKREERVFHLIKHHYGRTTLSAW